MFEAKHLHKRFGHQVVLEDVSMSFEAGRLSGIMGPNGAGKTTCFNLLTGRYRPDRGRVTFEGRDITGKPPRGWESPGLTETEVTADLLKEAGIEYVADWVLDDQPCEIRTAHGPLVSIPYTVEMNDIAMLVIQQHSSREWLQRGIDQFDRLYAESERITRVMAVSVHPYITGAPHRIRYLQMLYEYMLEKPGVLMWTGEKILDWYRDAAGLR